MSAHAASVTVTVPAVAIIVGTVTVDYTAGTDVTNLKYRTIDTTTCDATTIDPLLYTTGSSVSDNAVPGGSLYATTGSIVFNPIMSSNGSYACVSVTDSGSTTYHTSSTAINIIPMIMPPPPPPPPMPILGCTNPLATNYNPSATVNNGSCTLPVVAPTAGPGGGGGGGGSSSYTPMTSATPVVVAPSTVSPAVSTPVVTQSSTGKSVRFVVRTPGIDRTISTSQVPDGTTLTLSRLVGNKRVVITTVVVKDGKVMINQSQRGRYILTR
jgi:hypothetical protein